jgi:hypothetical protein
MENNFPDVLNDGETVLQFVDVTAKGKGQTNRARGYVRPLALRYVTLHQQLQLEIQQARRQPAVTPVDPQPAVAATPAVLTTPVSRAATASAALASVSTASAVALASVSTTSAVAVSTASNLFVDAHWSTELTDVEVEELDGTWREATIYRHKLDEVRVCLWFGQSEYEGLDPDRPYRYCPRAESLEDDEGFDINWRIKGVENDDEDEEDDDSY